MKKTIRILVSVILAVAILASACWYLLEYDPGFTRDFLLQQARNFEQQGRNSIAVWLYNLAYHQADRDDRVAIELAEYYQSIGNFTKAEYTLTKAIEDGATVELYIALCKTFVEQNKLRDAVQMLDQISNPNIRAGLDALRPAAPQPSAAPGFHSSYIRLSLYAPEAKIYYTVNGEFPSTESEPLTDEIPLSGGDSTVYAVAVSENGLVSPLGTYAYSIGNVIEKVTFTDKAFEDAIRSLLEIPDGQHIYSNALWELRTFSIPSSAVSCEDLRWLPNLTELTIHSCAFEDIRPISQLTKLESVTVKDSVLSTKDLAVFAQLPKLRSLTLSGCFLSSIHALEHANLLTHLDLSNNSIRDISALSNMTALTHLDLSYNGVVSLDALTGLRNLKHLDVSYNALVSSAPVAHLTDLTYLDLSAQGSTGLMVLEGIDALPDLTYFAASANNLTDVDILASCTKLETLIISRNTILNLDVLTAHTNLSYLDFSYNEVSSLPTFSSTCPLTIINGGYNQLSSLDRLAVLEKLEYVYMDYNANIKNINKLADCPALKVVNVYGSAVTNVSKLTAKGITVHYTPLQT